MGLDHQRVRVHGQQRVQREQVAGVLEHPPAIAVRQPDQLQVAPVPPVGAGPVLAAQPGGVARQVGQAFERDGPHRLPQQLPAFLHLVRRHQMDAHELGVGDLVARHTGLDHLEHRIARPGVPGRAGLRHLGQPQLQALVRGVGHEQPVQRGRAGPGEPGDEDGTLDGHLGVFRMPGPRRLAEQPGRQGAAQQGPGHPQARGGQAGVAVVGLQQDVQAVAVVIRPEIRQPGQPRRGRVQVAARADPVRAEPGRPGLARAGLARAAVRWLAAHGSRSVVELAAVDVQALAGDRPGHPGGQEHHRVRDLGGLREPRKSVLAAVSS